MGESNPQYIDKVLTEWNNISHFAYDNFMSKGRGAILLWEEGGETRFRYGSRDSFLNKGDKHQLHLVDTYNPEMEFLAVFEISGGLRTLRVRSPEGGFNPKQSWAREIFRRALESPEKLPDSFPAWFIEEHGKLLIKTLNDAVVSLYKQKFYERGVVAAAKALQISEQIAGPEHANTVLSLQNLAAMYVIQKQDALAEPLFKRMISIEEKSLGPEHPDVIENVYGLAVGYANQEQYLKAEPLYKRALAVKEKILGPEHPEVARILHNLAEAYWALGRYAQAEPLFKRCLAIREKALGPEDPFFLLSLNRLAEMYRAQGKHDLAAPLFERELASMEKILGMSHPDVISALLNLAALYRKTGMAQKAEELEKRVETIKAEKPAPESPKVSGPAPGKQATSP